MFAVKTIQFLLFFAILFQALAEPAYQSRSEPCVPKDEFTCRPPRSPYYTTYQCIDVNYLCDGDKDCSNEKDEICDGKLHIPTGICKVSDEKHCKGVSKGTAICSAGCAECTGRNQCAACSVNFSGKHCNETCPSGTFGRNCEFDCDYLLNEKGKFYSLCLSSNSVCGSKRIGDNCKPTCECKRADACRPGWIGNHCQVPCPDFAFGRFCSKKCDCIQRNSVGCDKTNGTCECKPQFYGEKCEHSCDQVKSEFSKSNLICLESKVHKLSNDKAALEKNLKDQKTAVEEKMEEHEASVEQIMTDHRSALDDHKEEVWQNLTDYQETVDQQFRDHKSSFEQNLDNHRSTLEQNLASHKSSLEQHKHHLAWNSSFTCVAFVLLFVAVSWMYLKNRKLKADLKVISVRYLGKQQSDSASEPKVTFLRSNLFQRVLDKFRFLTQNVPTTSIDQTYETSLLRETDKINAEEYATIDELKEQDAKEETIPMPELGHLDV